MTQSNDWRSARETPAQAALRFAKEHIDNGFVLEAVFPYCDAEGEILFWRVRLKHPNGKKAFPAMRWDGQRFVPGESPKPPQGKPLYRLPELLASTCLVYIVEGENKVDAIIALGGIATTSGSATTAGGTDWSVLRDRHVRFFRDTNEIGLSYARDVTRKLQGIAASIEWIDVAPLRLPEGGDVIDWLAMHPEATLDDLLALPRLPAPDMGEEPPRRNETPTRRESAQLKHTRPVPEPFRRPLMRPKPYPLEALGEVLGSAAVRIREVVQSPAALCGQSLLSAASLAVQALADVEIDGRREPLGLWHLSIGESGERKSATDGIALRAHRERERALADDYQREHATYETEASAYKAALRKAESKGEPAEVRATRKELGPAPRRPLEPWLLLGEPTLEGLHRVYQKGRPSIGLFNDDAGDFLHGHAMGQDNRAKSAAGLSRLWDCGEFSRVRAGEGVTKCYGRRLAMHIMVQPVIAERVLSDDLLTGQGFLARTLLTWPESTIGTREYVAEDLAADPAMRRYWQCMQDRLSIPSSTRQGTRNELSPRTLTLTPEAKDYWVDVVNRIERDMLGDFAGVKAWAAKSGAQILRIAGVLTLIDDAHASVIPLEAVERAVKIAGYHLYEAVRIIGTTSVPQRISDAEALIQWCRRTNRAWLYSADVLRFGPGSIRTRDAFLSAMTLLEATGWVEKEQRGLVLDNKLRARAWPVRAEVLG